MDNLTKQILTTVADGYDSARPGLGDCIREKIAADETQEFSIQQLAEIREVVLAVIDKGWKCSDGCDLHHAWRFNSKDDDQDVNREALDDQQRLRFVNAIQSRLTAALKGKGA